jgi:putative PIN family toxin of toxin-antitoxin system
MRVVADANIVVSGLLWRGPPRGVLDAARKGRVRLFTSAFLLAELEDVLRREKLAKRLRQASVSPEDLVTGFAALARVVKPVFIEPVVREDPTDDEVIACAVAAQATSIVSGDSHLLQLEKYGMIEIRTASQFLAFLESESSQPRHEKEPAKPFSAATSGA